MRHYTLDEQSTGRYQSLETAQRAGLQALASAIARAVRAGLESGRFTVEDGVVIIAKPHTMEAPFLQEVM